MSYLLDTDHITILQQQAGPEFAAIMAHIALHPPSELAFSIINGKSGLDWYFTA